MKQFLVFFRFEVKRLCNLRSIIIILFIFGLCFLLLESGIEDYRAALEMAEKFKIIEQKNFEKHKFYSFYGDEGINLLFVPAPESILTRNTPVPRDLLANVDSYFSLRIFNLYKGKSLYRRSLWGPYGLADILLLVGSLATIFYGFSAFRHREFLRSLTSLAGPVRVFSYLVISRLVVIALLFILFVLSSIMLVTLHQIGCSPGGMGNILALAGIAYGVLAFFFSCGVLTGLWFDRQQQSPGTGNLVLIATWFTFIFLLPGLVNHMIEKKAFDSSRDLQTEIDKMEKVLEFEKKSYKKEGKFERERLAPFINLIEKYWEKDYPQIENIEKRLRDHITRENSSSRFFSYAIPPAFFLLAAEECSSRGLDSFTRFYDYCRDTKLRFLRFWIDRVYYHDPREMVNFINKDENIFLSQSRLPHGTGIGFLVQFLYITGLLLLSYIRFGKNLFQVASSTVTPGLDSGFEQDILNQCSKYRVLSIYQEAFRDKLYNLLSRATLARKYREGQLAVNQDRSYFYLCGSEQIPGNIKVKDILTLFPSILPAHREAAGNACIKLATQPVPGHAGPGLTRLHELKVRMKDLSYMEKASLILALSNSVSSDIYIFNEVCPSPSPSIYIQVKKQLENLSQVGALVLLLTPWYNNLIPLEVTNKYCSDVTGHWSSLIEAIEDAGGE